MLYNRKRTYMLGTYTVENTSSGWFFKRTYGDDDWHGPYSSKMSVCLMIARQLKHELMKRDGVSESQRLDQNTEN